MTGKMAPALEATALAWMASELRGQDAVPTPGVTLCEALRDGRALCLLANSLTLEFALGDDHALTKKLEKSMHQLSTFHSLERIHFFIRWCRTAVRLEEQYIFNSVQLLDEANGATVAACLEALRQRFRPKFDGDVAAFALPVVTDDSSDDVTSDNDATPETATSTTTTTNTNSKLNAFLNKVPTATTPTPTPAERTPSFTSKRLSGTSVGSSLSLESDVPDEEEPAPPPSPPSPRATGTVSKLKVPPVFGGSANVDNSSAKEVTPTPVREPKPKPKSVSKLEIPFVFGRQRSASNVEDSTTPSVEVTAEPPKQVARSVSKLQIPAAFAAGASAALVEQPKVEKQVAPEPEPMEVPNSPRSKLAAFAKSFSPQQEEVPPPAPQADPSEKKKPSKLQIPAAFEKAVVKPQPAAPAKKATKLSAFLSTVESATEASTMAENEPVRRIASFTTAVKSENEPVPRTASFNVAAKKEEVVAETNEAVRSTPKVEPVVEQQPAKTEDEKPAPANEEHAPPASQRSSKLLAFLAVAQPEAFAPVTALVPDVPAVEETHAGSEEMAEEREAPGEAEAPAQIPTPEPEAEIKEAPVVEKEAEKVVDEQEVVTTPPTVVRQTSKLHAFLAATGAEAINVAVSPKRVVETLVETAVTEKDDVKTEVQVETVKAEVVSSVVVSSEVVSAEVVTAEIVKAEVVEAQEGVPTPVEEFATKELKEKSSSDEEGSSRSRKAQGSSKLLAFLAAVEGPSAVTPVASVNVQSQAQGVSHNSTDDDYEVLSDKEVEVARSAEAKDRADSYGGFGAGKDRADSYGDVESTKNRGDSYVDSKARADSYDDLHAGNDDLDRLDSDVEDDGEYDIDEEGGVHENATQDTHTDTHFNEKLDFDDDHHGPHHDDDEFTASHVDSYPDRDPIVDPSGEVVHEEITPRKSRVDSNASSIQSHPRGSVTSASTAQSVHEEEFKAVREERDRVASENKELKSELNTTHSVVKKQTGELDALKLELEALRRQFEEQKASAEETQREALASLRKEFESEALRKESEHKIALETARTEAKKAMDEQLRQSEELAAQRLAELETVREQLKEQERALAMAKDSEEAARYSAQTAFAARDEAEELNRVQQEKIEELTRALGH